MECFTQGSSPSTPRDGVNRPRRHHCSSYLSVHGQHLRQDPRFSFVAASAILALLHECCHLPRYAGQLLTCSANDYNNTHDGLELSFGHNVCQGRDRHLQMSKCKDQISDANITLHYHNARFWQHFANQRVRSQVQSARSSIPHSLYVQISSARYIAPSRPHGLLWEKMQMFYPVSYTHLTLPTKRIV